jgi:hypothetical protein
MTNRKTESNSEKGATYPGLEAARAKLAEVQTQARAIEDRLREILEAKRTEEGRAGDLMVLAEALLEGGAETLPARDFDSELRALWQQKEIINKAMQIQAGRLDEAALAAASTEYRRMKPSYCLEIKKLISAVEAYRAAVLGMAKIREGMTAAGLSCGFPAVNFPGWSVDSFEKKRETLAWTLKQQGLELNLKS